MSNHAEPKTRTLWKSTPPPRVAFAQSLGESNVTAPPPGPKSERKIRSSEIASPTRGSSGHSTPHASVQTHVGAMGGCRSRHLHVIFRMPSDLMVASWPQSACGTKNWGQWIWIQQASAAVGDSGCISSEGSYSTRGIQWHHVNGAIKEGRNSFIFNNTPCARTCDGGSTTCDTCSVFATLGELRFRFISKSERTSRGWTYLCAAYAVAGSWGLLEPHSAT